MSNENENQIIESIEIVGDNLSSDDWIALLEGLILALKQRLDAARETNG